MRWENSLKECHSLGDLQEAKFLKLRILYFYIFEPQVDHFQSYICCWIFQCSEWLKGDETAVVLRFLGTTPSSSDIEKLLISIISQIHLVNQKKHSIDGDDEDFKNLNQRSKKLFSMEVGQQNGNDTMMLLFNCLWPWPNIFGSLLPCYYNDYITRSWSMQSISSLINTLYHRDGTHCLLPVKVVYSQVSRNWLQNSKMSSSKPRL